MKRGLLAAVILTIGVLGLGMGESVTAAEKSQVLDMQTGESTWINPLCEDASDLSFDTEGADSEAVSATGANEYSSISSAAKYVKKQMLVRASQITFSYSGSGFNSDTLREHMDKILLKACEVTSKPTEGDYLRYQAMRVERSYQYTSTRANVTWKITYASTASQESVMGAEIKKAVKSLKLSNCTDLEKVKKIYDYICENTTYYGDGTNYYHSAYAALLDNSAVCQGFATLFYAMCVESDVEVRCVAGKAYSGGSMGDHLWNIVKIGSKWYNLDVTWDSVYYETGYRYFLQNEDDFVNHYRYDEYDTTTFLNKCPMTDGSYTGAAGKVTLKKVASSGTSTLKLTWGKVNTATGYQIYYAASKNGKYEKLKTIKGGAVTSYKATKLTPGKTYYFKIRAVSNILGSTVGSYSSVVSGKPVPAKVQIENLTAKSKSITASWEKVSGADGYEIIISYKKGEQTKTEKVTVKGGSSLSKKLNGLKSGKTYSIKVRAYKNLKSGKTVYGKFSVTKKKVAK